MFHFSDSAVFTTNGSTPFAGCFCRLKIDWTHWFHEPSGAIAALSKLQSNVFIEPYVWERLRWVLSLHPLIAESARPPSVGFCVCQSAGLEKLIYSKRAAVVKMCWTRSMWSAVLVELLPSSHSRGKWSVEGKESSDHWAELLQTGEKSNIYCFHSSRYHNAPKNQVNL